MEQKDAKLKARVICPKGVRNDNPYSPWWGGKYGYVKGTIIGVNDWDDDIEDDKQLFVKWDNGKYNHYKFAAINLAKGQKGGDMKETIKSVASDVREFVKPYEKWIGLIALAYVIDNFMLGNKFTDRFKQLGENIVQRATKVMDELIDKVAPDKIEDNKEEPEETHDETKDKQP